MPLNSFVFIAIYHFKNKAREAEYISLVFIRFNSFIHNMCKKGDNFFPPESKHSPRTLMSDPGLYRKAPLGEILNPEHKLNSESSLNRPKKDSSLYTCLDSSLASASQAVIIVGSSLLICIVLFKTILLRVLKLQNTWKHETRHARDYAKIWRSYAMQVGILRLTMGPIPKACIASDMCVPLVKMSRMCDKAPPQHMYACTGMALIQHQAIMQTDGWVALQQCWPSVSPFGVGDRRSWPWGGGAFWKILDAFSPELQWKAQDCL